MALQLAIKVNEGLDCSEIIEAAQNFYNFLKGEK